MNKEVDSLKKSQKKIKLEMKISAIKPKISGENLTNR